MYDYVCSIEPRGCVDATRRVVVCLLLRQTNGRTHAHTHTPRQTEHITVHTLTHTHNRSCVCVYIDMLASWSPALDVVGDADVARSPPQYIEKEKPDTIRVTRSPNIERSARVVVVPHPFKASSIRVEFRRDQSAPYSVIPGVCVFEWCVCACVCVFC